RKTERLEESRRVQHHDIFDPLAPVLELRGRTERQVTAARISEQHKRSIPVDVQDHIRILENAVFGFDAIESKETKWIKTPGEFAIAQSVAGAGRKREQG